MKSIFHQKLHILQHELNKYNEIEFKDKELVINMCKNKGFDIPFINIHVSDLDNSPFNPKISPFQFVKNGETFIKNLKLGVYKPYSIKRIKEFDYIIPYYVQSKAKGYDTIFAGKLTFKHKLRQILNCSAIRNGYSSLNTGCPEEYSTVKYIGDHKKVIEQLQWMQDRLIELNIQDKHKICGAAIDWRRGYNQLPYKENNKVKIGLQFMDTIMEPKYVMFGHAPGGRYCQAVNEALCTITAVKYKYSKQQHQPLKITNVDFIRSFFLPHVDDDLILGFNSIDCNDKLSLLKDTANIIGLQLAPEKESKPNTTFTWTGAVFDTINQTIEPTKARKGKIIYLALKLIKYNKLTLHDWESLHGCMQSVAYIRWPLKTYCRPISAFISNSKMKNYTKYIKIKPTAIVIEMIYRFIVIMIEIGPTKWEYIFHDHQPIERFNTKIIYDSDACQKYGNSGAFGSIRRDTGDWLFVQYNNNEANVHINIKEMHGMLALPFIESKQGKLKNNKFMIRTDNTSTWWAWINKKSKNDDMHNCLLNAFELFAKTNNFGVAWWISTTDNILADLISRGKINEARTEAKKQGINMKHKSILLYDPHGHVTKLLDL